MNPSPNVSEVLRRLLSQPTRGVVGLVDDLLTVCREQGLELDWQADRCRVRPAGGDWEELSGVPLRKSVFRAVLARVAALCNEQTPNSVSPYGGQAELPAGANPAAVFRVFFANTPTEQKLRLTTDTESAAPAPPRRGPVEQSARFRGTP
jgi:hypothetical protein